MGSSFGAATQIAVKGKRKNATKTGQIKNYSITLDDKIMNNDLGSMGKGHVMGPATFLNSTPSTTMNQSSPSRYGGCCTSKVVVINSTPTSKSSPLKLFSGPVTVVVDFPLTRL